ncbi:MAG: hypothetical protein U9N73_03260 [Candidatus Auribacterota bacterium]|nr:hypothetical protein [Candidatus Auribacterota bacterium]
MANIKEKILMWIEERISSSPDFVIPVKQLREELVDGLSVPVPSLEEIEGWLDENKRFDLLPEPDGAGDLPPEQIVALEQTGIYNGLRVGLKSRRPTQEEILQRLEEHSNSLLASVQKGYAAGDIDDEAYEQLEENLVGFLQKLQKAKGESGK